MSGSNRFIVARRILFWVLLSITCGAATTSLIEQSDWMSGFLATTILYFVAIGVLYGLFRFAGRGKTLAWMIGVAFVLRLGIGISLMEALPVLGYPTDQ